MKGLSRCSTWSYVDTSTVCQNSQHTGVSKTEVSQAARPGQLCFSISFPQQIRTLAWVGQSWYLRNLHPRKRVLLLMLFISKFPITTVFTSTYTSSTTNGAAADKKHFAHFKK